MITVPANRWMWSAHDDNCMHYRRYDKQSLISLLQRAGFEIKYISYYNFFLFFPIAAVRIISKCFHLDKDSEIENTARDGFVNQLLYKIFASEKKRICRGKIFPCGVSLVAVVEKSFKISRYEIS